MAGEPSEGAASESVDLDGAAEMMMNVADEPGDEGNGARTEGDEIDAPEAGAAEAEGAAQEGDEVAQEPETEEQDVDPEAPADGAEAPKFWAEEDKKAWDAVPPEVRPILQKYEQQRVEFVNTKTREAAEVRQRATEEVQKATSVVDQAAAWWQAQGPAFMQAFADKWSGVNWDHLAEHDPAEHTRLMHMRNKEAAVVAEANRRGQADIADANTRAAAALQESKRTEHAKLATKLPTYFGTPEVSTKTYDELGKFLFSKGIPADRINSIHEAPIIELALSAMRFERAQKKASTVREAARNPANPAPRRVAPGPAGAGNRVSDAARQVGARFMKGGSVDDAAELIRLHGL